MTGKTQTLIPPERIEGHILLVRGHKVMMDADLAQLYDVETRVLVQAVKRNLSRFPGDFMFQLTAEEFTALRSQTVISNTGRGGRRTPPYAFTEQGVARKWGQTRYSNHSMEVIVSDPIYVRNLSPKAINNPSRGNNYEIKFTWAMTNL